ncbi:MAG: glycosyltransferase family 2 protein [bacterium]
MNKISAIIIAQNEEEKIERVVTSLVFCDEVLVVDDESVDETRQKAEKAGARVIVHSTRGGFANQRNWAMKQARNEWVLFVDADEEMSKNLKYELENLKLDGNITSYAIPRRDFFWNTELKHGETRKARAEGIIRLMKKGSGTWAGAVHETFQATGGVGKVNAYLDHYSHDTLAEFVQDINVYSTRRAIELHEKGKKTSLFELIFYPFGKFFYTYIVLGGLLDGPAGFVYSFVMSFHSFLVRAKLITQTYV